MKNAAQFTSRFSFLDSYLPVLLRVDMSNFSKSSLNYFLSEYLADLKRAGVQEVWRGRGPSYAARTQAENSDAQARPDHNSPEPEDPRRRQNAPPAQYSEPAYAGPSAFDDRPVRDEYVPASDEEYYPDYPAAPPMRRQPAPAAPSRPAPPMRPPVSGNRMNLPLASANPPADPAEFEARSAKLRACAEQVAQCTLCPQLCESRRNTVFGSGNPCAELVFIGEGPGAEEDLRGEPFVGRSGNLLTDMIEKGMGIPRPDVYICNIVRCRPPANRNPTDAEADACRPFLDATLDVVKPKYICCLGAIAATHLLNVTMPIGKLRGIEHDYKGAKVICTYHPAYLLRNPPAKKDAWQDLQLLMKVMGIQPKR